MEPWDFFACGPEDTRNTDDADYVSDFDGSNIYCDLPYAGSRVFYLSDEARRAFPYATFGRELVEDDEKNIEVLNDSIEIWRELLPMKTFEALPDFAVVRGENGTVVIPTAKRLVEQLANETTREKLLKRAEESGLEHAIEAYFAGVPIEDIIA